MDYLMWTLLLASWVLAFVLAYWFSNWLLFSDFEIRNRKVICLFGAVFALSAGMLELFLLELYSSEMYANEWKVTFLLLAVLLLYVIPTYLFYMITHRKLVAAIGAMINLYVVLLIWSSIMTNIYSCDDEC
jgi:hypothetical protein